MNVDEPQSNQDKLIDFVSDPETIKKAVEGSMDKRAELDEVSLCPSCYCMTHTVDGRCGKCKASKSLKDVQAEDAQRHAVLDTLQRLFLDGIADGGTGGSMDESVADAYLAIEEIYSTQNRVNKPVDQDNYIDMGFIEFYVPEDMWESAREALDAHTKQAILDTLDSLPVTGIIDNMGIRRDVVTQASIFLLKQQLGE